MSSLCRIMSSYVVLCRTIMLSYILLWYIFLACMVKSDQKPTLSRLDDAPGLRKSTRIAIQVLHTWQKERATGQYSKMCESLSDIEKQIDNFEERKVDLEKELEVVETNLKSMRSQSHDIFTALKTTRENLKDVGFDVAPPLTPKRVSKRKPSPLESEKKKSNIDSDETIIQSESDGEDIDKQKGEGTEKVVEGSGKVGEGSGKVGEVSDEDEDLGESPALDARGKPFCVIKDVQNVEGQKNPKKYFCSVHVDKGYTRLADLKNHMKICVNKALPYKCKKCDKSYKRIQGLREHIASTHTHSYIHFCKECGKGFYFGSLKTAHQSKCTGRISTPEIEE